MATLFLIEFLRVAVEIPAQKNESVFPSVSTEGRLTKIPMTDFGGQMSARNGNRYHLWSSNGHFDFDRISTGVTVPTPP